MAEKRTRNVKKSEFVLQQYSDGVAQPQGWYDVALDPANPQGPIKCAADLRKYVKAAGLAGQFRVIAVRDTFTTKAETVTKVVFE